MEPTVPFQPNHSEYGFTKNTAVHFGGAQFAINEDDRHFLYLEATFVGGEFHFYLEGVSFEADTVQIDGLQYPAAVTYKSGCSIVDGQPREEAYLFGGKIRHQYTSHGPVHYVHTTHIT